MQHKPLRFRAVARLDSQLLWHGKVRETMRMAEGDAKHYLPNPKPWSPEISILNSEDHKIFFMNRT